MTYKAFKYRLYPTAPQAEKINQNIGCARFVYNQLLDDRIKVWKETKQLSTKTYSVLKEEHEFLKNADSRALKHAQANLDEAYEKFKKEPNTGYPKFKAKHKCRLSYTTDNNSNAVRFDGNRLRLPKVGFVKVVEHRKHEGRILTATISKERSGEYYASVLCEIEPSQVLPVTDKVVGIDLGLHDLVVCSDGTRVKAPKHFRKAEQKLAKRQRVFSRTQKGSKGHEKARLKVARCHQKIKNQRNDFLQKLSTKLIKENQIICLEDLSVKGMERNHKLAKSVTDASFSRFVSMLEYKAEWYGRKIIKIDRFYPSTQLCSGCGYKNESIKGLRGLKVREWICPECGEVHDRDLNASRNILKEGLKILNLRNVGDSKFTVHHNVLVEMCLHLKPTAFRRWVVHKRQFQTRVLNLAKQIAENWCLCQYCHKYAKTFSTYVHWKSELEGYLDELNTMSIDNDRSREKWSLEILRKGDFDDAQKVFRQCKRKFMIERVLNMPNNLQIEVCEDFASMIEDIAKCIGSVDGIVPFTCKWFPEVLTTFDIQWKSEHQ